MNDDLISRSELRKKLQARYDNGEEEFDKGYNIGVASAIELLDNAPTVEITDYDTGYQDGLEDGLNDIRPQGEWIYHQEWFEDEKEPRMTWGCNRCGFSIKSVHEKRNFCPNCGARMEGGAE